MEELDNYRFVLPVLAPLKFEKNDNREFEIVIDYSKSVDQYGEGEKELFTKETFLDEEDCADYLDGILYELEENGNCNRYVQKIGDTYYYLHVLMAKIRYEDDMGFLSFGKKSLDDMLFLLREENFETKEELIEYIKKDSECVSIKK